MIGKMMTILCGTILGAYSMTTQAANPIAHIHTTAGEIVVELNKEKAPLTVENFIRYANEKFFDGTIFHRVIPDFMIQGGGFTESFVQKATHDPVKNEADNGLKNERGTIAMARTPNPQSATAQFFINVKDNDFLNFKAPMGNGWGYAVFGKVTKGMDIVDKIQRAPTGAGGPFPTDVPQQTIRIEKVVIE